MSGGSSGQVFHRGFQLLLDLLASFYAKVFTVLFDSTLDCISGPFGLFLSELS